MTMLEREIAPKFQQIDTIEFLKSTKSFLDNGIPVHMLAGGTQEILKIDFIFNAGTYYQIKPLIARATNQLLQEGSKSYSSMEIATGIDQYGSFLHCETSYDTSTITLYSLSKYLNKVLPYFSEIILHPTFPEKEFNTLKNNSLEKFKINQEKVSFLARQEFIQTIFDKEHPYGNIAHIEDFSTISLQNIRDFYSDYYTLDNCQIIISGNTNNEVVNSLNNFFGKEVLPSKKKENKLSLTQKDSGDAIFIDKKDALQSAIRIGRLFPNKLHQDYHGLKILNAVLGGYFGSRLMKNIREDKGYTYGIGSDIISLKEGGYFFISTEVGSSVTKKALKEIYKEIELLRTEEIPQQELNLVKNYLLGKLLKSCDGPFNMASLFESVLLYDMDYDHYNDYIQTIKNITPKVLLDLANKYLNKSSLTEIVVGNQE